MTLLPKFDNSTYNYSCRLGRKTPNLTIFSNFSCSILIKFHKIVFVYKIGGFGGISAIGLTKSCQVFPLGGLFAQFEDFYQLTLDLFTLQRIHIE